VNRTEPAHVATDDCERLRAGLIAQPVNSGSSLAYCAVGAWILRGRPVTFHTVALGTSAIAAGVGSVLYHGPGGRAGRLVHDATAALLAGVTVVALTRRHAPQRASAVACLAAAGALHTASRSGRVLCRPDSLLQGHAGWHVLTAAALVLASR
jgi:hypothetical protein